MSYRPGRVPDDPKLLPAFLREEFQRMQKALDAPQKTVRLLSLHAAPEKYGEGDVILADGTDFNPGSGKGLYIHDGTAWVLIKAL
jgi:hypothetical protein